jgi:hypothetical protein
MRAVRRPLHRYSLEQIAYHRMHSGLFRTGRRAIYGGQLREPRPLDSALCRPRRPITKHRVGLRARPYAGREIAA